MRTDEYYILCSRGKNKFDAVESARKREILFDDLPYYLKWYPFTPVGSREYLDATFNLQQHLIKCKKCKERN